MQDSKNKISDPKITQHVAQRLASCGIRSPSRVVVTSANGEVTLSGTVQYQHQRQSVMQATRNIEGVRGVVDMLKLIATPTRN
jgi:osmotically-inducible protein OsmY